MPVFWEQGFAATSIDALVSATAVGRGGIYADFGGKQALFLACLDAYRVRFADPAIALLTSNKDGFAAIEAFFDFFISLHAKHGMPGPGCFLANAMTEVAPHSDAVLAVVSGHAAALRDGFLQAVTRAAAAVGAALSEAELDEIAAFLATSSQGLWSYGRSVSDIAELTRFKTALMKMLRSRLAP
jgi:TetR/AcrR family transcriptional repressor of nem operon